jgi:hypothetical protein
MNILVKNEAFHFKLHTCSVCNFKTESSTVNFTLFTIRKKEKD